MKRNGFIAVASAGAVALMLTACGEAPKVDGVQDDTRHRAAVTQRVQVQDTSRQCASYKNGKCTSWRTVNTGSHWETRTVRPERWCVELDNVNGDRGRDDVWFTVSFGTYNDATDRDEGDQVTDMPYQREGC